jgi:uncharacterized membrane protein
LVLRVRIPDNAVGGTTNEIQITATSKYPNLDNTVVSDNAICLAQVTPARRGLVVRISPAEATAGVGENLSFTVTVTNTGNVPDNYALTLRDSAVPSWRPTLDNYLLEDVPAGGNAATTLRVTIPPEAGSGASDNITVTARSRRDVTIENSASCTARVPVLRGVSVSISPSSQSGANGETLTYTVTVFNTSVDLDTYDLSASDDQGWELQLDEDTLTILAGENTTVNLSVTVPTDAREGDSDLITITATSRADPTKSDSDTCRAIAKLGGLLPVVIGLGVVVVAAFTVALLVKKGIIHLSFFRLRSRQLRLRPQGLKPEIDGI